MVSLDNRVYCNYNLGKRKFMSKYKRPACISPQICQMDVAKEKALEELFNLEYFFIAIE